MKIVAESKAAISVKGELADIAELTEMADKKIGPTLDASSQVVQFHRGFGVDTWPSHQKHEHAVPGFEMACEYALPDRLHFVRTLLLIAQTQNRNPNPR